MPPSEVPTQTAVPSSAPKGSNSAKSVNPLDEPVEDDSDGITEVLPPPNDWLPQRVPPVQPSKQPNPTQPRKLPIKPADSIKPPDPVEVPTLDTATQNFWNVEILGNDGFDPDMTLAPWDVSSKPIDWPEIIKPESGLKSESISEPPIEVATKQPNISEPISVATESTTKWKSFRPDPKRDWYAAPR